MALELTKEQAASGNVVLSKAGAELPKLLMHTPEVEEAHCPFPIGKKIRELGFSGSVLPKGSTALAAKSKDLVGNAIAENLGIDRSF